jgi:ribosomal protein L40E
MVRVICGGCDAEVADPSAFCPECGTELDYAVCPECASPLPSDAEDCVECGYSPARTASGGSVGADRGLDVATLEEAIGELDSETSDSLLELLRTDPTLIRAFAYLVNLEEPPYGLPDDAPDHQRAIYDLVEDTGLKKSVDRVTREFQEQHGDLLGRGDVPEDPGERWVEAQLEELVGYGALGRYDARSGPEYADVPQILSDTLSMSDVSLAEIDDCAEETGLSRELITYRVLDASMSYLDLSE